MNKTVQVGDRFKVKATPHLRKWGVRVHRWDNSSSDNRAWPGEIGVVERTDYTAHNGEPMTCYHLVFERDRRLGMDGGMDGEPPMLRNPEELVKVKVAPATGPSWEEIAVAKHYGLPV